MIPNIYKVTEKIGKGTLYVMPRPSEIWLEEDIKYFSSIGIDIVVSLLEKSEAIKLGLKNEAELLKKNNISGKCFFVKKHLSEIQFINYPIKDRDIPKDADFEKLVISIHRELLDGHNVAIHCRAGIGRTGVLSSCILIHDGYNSQSAIDFISLARGVPIPDTKAQFKFICNYLK